ncbi:peptide ABC transporter substrate-binding protein, partial [Bacillus thuringiensis]
HHIGEATNILSDEDISVEDLENNIDVTISSPTLKANNLRYIIGQKVIDENIKGIEMEKKSDKSKDDLVLLVTLAGLAITAMKKQPNKDKIDVTYDLSVALPVATITPQTAQEFVERYMNHHTVKFHHPSGREVVVNIKIEFCKCLPEGAAGSWG